MDEHLFVGHLCLIWQKYEHFYQQQGEYSIALKDDAGETVAELEVVISSVDCHISLLQVDRMTIVARYYGREGIEYAISWGDGRATHFRAIYGTGLALHTYGGPGTYYVGMAEIWAPMRTYFSVAIEQQREALAAGRTPSTRGGSSSQRVSPPVFDEGGTANTLIATVREDYDQTWLRSQGTAADPQAATPLELASGLGGKKRARETIKREIGVASREARGDSAGTKEEGCLDHRR